MKLPAEYCRPVRIGNGAFASVYRVYQKKLERNVALKIIPSCSNRAGIAIVNEARALASAGSSCAPHIYDIRQSGNSVIIVMEWIRGVPLSISPRLELSDGEKSALACDIITSLANLHRNDIAHRDLKPGNIIVSPDRGLVFVDFGFSCNNRNSGASASINLQGTPPYMAPELWNNSNTVDLKKADIYSLGIILQNLYGKNLPAAAARCCQSDPALRPENAAALLQEWNEPNTASDRTSLARKVFQATAEYTSGLLYCGAAELCTGKHIEEAYALLTESIQWWPDNPDALQLLHGRFSSHMPVHRSKRRLLQYAAAALLPAAIIGAYFTGRESSKETPGPGSYFSLPVAAEEPLLMFPHTASSKHDPAALTLRSTVGSNELTATLSVVPAKMDGSVWVDGRKLGTCTENVPLDLALPAGTHRIEWHDSASDCAFGETVDLFPFSHKTISFARFAYE